MSMDLPIMHAQFHQSHAHCKGAIGVHRRRLSGPLRASELSRKAKATSRCLCQQQASSNATSDPEDTWDRVSLLRRELQVAVSQEDFQQAARLRDEAAALRKHLPPVAQYVVAQLQELQAASSTQKQTEVISALGDTGSRHALPELYVYLRQAHLADAALTAIMLIWQSHSDPFVRDMLRGGTSLMEAGHLEGALDVFDRLVQLQPSFAEGWNKKATVLYLLQRPKESIEDCKMVLNLEPQHCLALSGMGLCYLHLQDRSSALKCFEQCLEVHPHMDNIKSYVAALRAEQNR